MYELVERWGVRYLIDRDVLPDRAVFKLPELDVVMEPVFRVRAHPSIQDYAPSGESWGIADFRPLIDQLAKMKFNRLNVLAFGYQPYLDWQLKGVRRSSASLWYDYHYPITADMIGRELSDKRQEFGIDLPFNASYDELVAAGISKCTTCSVSTSGDGDRRLRADNRFSAGVCSVARSRSRVN